MKAGILKGAAHITGGGITENTPRMLPDGLAAEIDWGSWPVLPIFEFLRKLGNIPDDDYRRSFNLGLGMIFAVGRKKLSRSGTRPGQTRRSLLPHRPGHTCSREDSRAGGLPVRRLGILISGRGSNFQAIANSIRDREAGCGHRGRHLKSRVCRGTAGRS